MPFAVVTRTEAGVIGRSATIHVLEGEGERAEVWPALGFNCFRWQVEREGQLLDLLYDDPGLFREARPTRSGIPILFPFPNRLRAGRFTWQGKEYQAPLNDGPKQNAIHGFACQRPWRLQEVATDEHSAWVTAEFQGSKDAPECRDCWPADYRLRVTCRLGRGTLRLESVVSNPDSVPLPFGLGYHPYFRLPFTAQGRPEDCTVEVPARSFWELESFLPTGKRLRIDPARDLNPRRHLAELTLDDVLTDLPHAHPGPDGLIPRAALRDGGDHTLRLSCTEDFRELVVFTPGHRQAFCVEPYTCPTDAVNLEARGIPCGWRVLPPGGQWSSVVELRV